jgi:hypothetical protein
MRRISFVLTVLGSVCLGIPSFAQPDEQAYHLAQHQDHAFVHRPSSWGGDRLVGSTLYSNPTAASGSSNFYLQRQAADGTVIWEREYHYDHFDLLGHAEVNASGTEIVAVGSAESSQLPGEKAFALRVDAATGAVLGSTMWVANNEDVRLLHVAYVASGMGNQPMWVAAGWSGHDNSKGAVKQGWVVAFSTTLGNLWQRTTDSPSFSTAVPPHDWDMANHVLSVPGTGMLISGSSNGAQNDANPDQAGLAYMVDVNGNLKWKHATHLETTALNARMVTAGGHVQGSSIVQIANELGPQCFAVRTLNPATGAQTSGYRVDVGGGSAAVPKAFDTQIFGTGFVVGGYLNDYTWTVTTPNGSFQKTANQPFHLQFTSGQTGGITPAANMIVHRVEPVTAAGELVTNDFLAALRPTEQPYIFHPRMLELSGDTGVVLTAWRDRYLPASHDLEWIISNFAGTQGTCDAAPLPVVTATMNWVVKTGPTIGDAFLLNSNVGPTVTTPVAEIIPCGEIGYPECNPAYAPTYTTDCDPREATFTATASGSPVTPLSDMVFDWDFGDGSTGTGATVTHAYAADGTYTVTLTAYCVWDPSTAVSSVFTVTFTCAEDCVLPLVGPLATEWVHSCGETPELRAIGMLLPTPFGSSGFCSGWEIDGTAVVGEGIEHFVLAAGEHTVCRTVWCCDDPTNRRERCVDVVASPCPALENLDFTVVNLTGGECAGCLKGLSITWDGGPLEDCQNLEWDFSWTAEDPVASVYQSITACVPPLPFGHTVCLRQTCPITGEVIQEICKSVTCWKLLPGLPFDNLSFFSGWWLVPEIATGPCSLSADIGTYEDDLIAHGFHGTYDGPFLTPGSTDDGGPNGTPPYTLPEIDFPLVSIANGWAIVDATTGFPVFEIPGALAIRDTDYGSESAAGNRFVEGFPDSAMLVFNLTTPLGLLQWTSGPHTFGCANSDACASDLNDDGTVTVTDLLVLLGTFGEQCE